MKFRAPAAVRYFAAAVFGVVVLAVASVCALELVTAVFAFFTFTVDFFCGCLRTGAFRVVGVRMAPALEKPPDAGPGAGIMMTFAG